jgi:nicotinamidase-related amidase
MKMMMNSIPVGLLFASALALAATLHTTRSAREPPTTLRALYGLERPKSLATAHTALVLVDFQEEFVDGRLALPAGGVAIEHAVELATWARRSGILVVLVRHVAARPESPVFAPGSRTTAFVHGLEPSQGDFVLQKAVAGAFSRTNLDAELRGRGVDTLIVAGLMTHLAVFVTVSDATVLGYRVIVAADATATRDLPGAGGEDGVGASVLQRALLDAMADRFADVMPTRAIAELPLIR